MSNAPSQPRRSGRQVRDNKPNWGRRFLIGGIIALILAGFAAWGIARWSATHSFREGDTISFSKSCGRGATSYFEGRLMSISTVNAIVMYPNDEGRTVAEELDPGGQIYVDGACGRYAVAAVEEVIYHEGPSQYPPMVKIRAYYFPSESDGQNPIQVAPAPAEHYQGMEAYTLNPGDQMTVLVRGDNVNHDYVVHWDGNNISSNDGACVDDHVTNMYTCDGFPLIVIASISPDGKLTGTTPNYEAVVFRKS